MDFPDSVFPGVVSSERWSEEEEEEDHGGGPRRRLSSIPESEFRVLPPASGHTHVAATGGCSRSSSSNIIKKKKKKKSKKGNKGSLNRVLEMTNDYQDLNLNQAVQDVNGALVKYNKP